MQKTKTGTLPQSEQASKHRLPVQPISHLLCGSDPVWVLIPLWPDHLAQAFKIR
jgi:hypothetical protein